jgi:hypothetical protein
MAKSIEGRLLKLEQTGHERRLLVACSRETEAAILSANPQAAILRVHTGVPRAGRAPFLISGRS